MREKTDFVDVQLTADGVALAGKDGAIQISTAHLSYKFTPGSTTRVLTSEWAKVLAKEAIDGKLLFEAAPAVLASAPANATPEEKLHALKADETQIDAEIAPAQEPASSSSPSSTPKGNE